MKLRALALIALLCPLGTATAPSAADAAVWCNQIAIVGDSLTSQGNGALHVQFPKAIINARGGRVASEAYEAALGIDESNATDCWVFAIGTNDVYLNLGVAVSQPAVAKMVSLIGATDHVWWVLPQFVSGGSLSANLDPAWFANLLPPGVQRIALHLAPTDFTSDGIHLTAAGYVHRAAAIAAVVGA